jgi:hypothetical protein
MPLYSIALPPPASPHRLPAVACTPPLQLDFVVVPGSDPANPAAWIGLVVLRYAVNPGAPSALLDVRVEMDLAPEMKQPSRVSAERAWCMFVFWGGGRGGDRRRTGVALRAMGEVHIQLLVSGLCLLRTSLNSHTPH